MEIDIQLALDILQTGVNASVIATLVLGVLGRVFPDDRVNRAAFSFGAFLSKWGIRTFNVATWNAIEAHLIHTFDNINSGFGTGLRSDNKE